MLGSRVIVDNPRNPFVITQLQNRNMRVTVNRQKATVMYELFDPNQPIEQFNANIVTPVKPIHETKTDNDSNSSSTQETTSTSTSTSSTSISSHDLTPTKPTPEPTVEPATLDLNTTTSTFNDQHQIPPNSPIAYQLRRIYRKLDEMDKQIAELKQKNASSPIVNSLQTTRNMIAEKVLDPLLQLEKWYEDLSQLQNRHVGCTVDTITSGKINYYTGIPTDIK